MLMGFLLRPLLRMDRYRLTASTISFGGRLASDFAKVMVASAARDKDSWLFVLAWEVFFVVFLTRRFCFLSLFLCKSVTLELFYLVLDRLEEMGLRFIDSGEVLEKAYVGGILRRAYLIVDGYAGLQEGVLCFYLVELGIGFQIFLHCRGFLRLSEYVVES